MLFGTHQKTVIWDGNTFTRLFTLDVGTGSILFTVNLYDSPDFLLGCYHFIRLFIVDVGAVVL